MKDVARGLLTFLIAFGIGLVAAMIFLHPHPDVVEIEQNGVPAIVTNDVAALTPASYGETSPDMLILDSFIPDIVTESFTDENRIGRPGKNKIELRCVPRENGTIAEITFYTLLKNGDWLQKQSFKFEKDTLTPCDPKIEDFNNDGLNDFTYRSNVAARGANEIRTLFIYDKKDDNLKHIKNSEDYPNIEYNKKLNCLDAWLFHAATTTVFLRIEDDMLKEFASIDTGLELVVSVKTPNEERILRREKMSDDDIYTRFTNFNPVEY